MFWRSKLKFYSASSISPETSSSNVLPAVQWNDQAFLTLLFLQELFTCWIRV